MLVPKQKWKRTSYTEAPLYLHPRAHQVVAMTKLWMVVELKYWQSDHYSPQTTVHSAHNQ